MPLRLLFTCQNCSANELENTGCVSLWKHLLVHTDLDFCVDQLALTKTLKSKAIPAFCRFGRLLEILSNYSINLC